MSVKKSSSSSSSSSFVTYGNILNVTVLTLNLLYAGCVVYFTQPDKTKNSTFFLDEEWKANGFCIQNKHIPYWSSFDTCLYVDTIFTAVLGILYWKWKAIPGMEIASQQVPFVIIGTLGHGFAHGATAIQFRNSNDETEASAAAAAAAASDDRSSNSSPNEHAMWKIVLFATFFWFPLLKASMMKASNVTIAALTVLVTFAGTRLRENHLFAYVQTVLAIAYHSSQLVCLSKAEKQHREYVTLPLWVALLPNLTAWNEALFCTAYFKAVGGHVWYDASIIGGYLVFYIDSYRYHVLSNSRNNDKLDKIQSKKEL